MSLWYERFATMNAWVSKLCVTEVGRVVSQNGSDSQQ
jgi:hypothetical protein